MVLKTREELLAKLDKGLRVAEIGVFKGDFSKIIYDTMQPLELHLIDLFTGKMVSGDKNGANVIEISLDEAFLNLQKDFKEHENVYLHKGKSGDILAEFPDNYFDFIYIDGDHSYEGVKSDIALSRLKVKLEGFIGGHDYTPAFQGVMDAVNEFKGEDDFIYLTEDGCPSWLLKNKK